MKQVNFQLLIRLFIRRGFTIGLLLAWLFAASTYAKESITVAVLSDFNAGQPTSMDANYIEELRTLVNGEFDLNIIDSQIDWQADVSSDELAKSINRQVNEIYQDPEIDMLLVAGVGANQVLINRESYPKPTFLPMIIESELINAPEKDGTSDKRNLNYLTYSFQFIDSLTELKKVVDYDKVAILSDDILLTTLPQSLQQQLLSENFDSVVQLVAHDGENHNLLDQIDAEVDTVILGHLPRLPAEEVQTLIDGLIDKKLATFSYVDTNLIELGLLATSLSRDMLQKTARMNALNMQSVMLGEPASRQPIVVEVRPKLTINFTTAERIGLDIDFRTLVDANVVGLSRGANAQKHDLLSLTSLALEQNLSVIYQNYALELQQQEQAIAKGQLLPQFNLELGHLRRADDTQAVQAQFTAERSTDASIGISQVLFSDTEFANYKIQSLLYEASNEAFRQKQLDTIRETSLAMADVLQAQAGMELQQERMFITEKNSDLAKDRVQYGATSSAENFRWETQVANASSATFSTYNRLILAQQNLALILNVPIDQTFQIDPIQMDEVMVFSRTQLFDIFDNTNSFEQLYRFALAQAYQLSPEIKQLNSSLAAKQREVTSISRQRWLPRVSLSGELSENLQQTDTQFGEEGERDWVVMLNAQVPLFQGGQLSSRLKKTELEYAQLENQLAQTKVQVSANLRTSMNTLLAALFNLEFTKTARESAQKSLDLVTDSYSKGALPIVDLLDAQNSSDSAKLAEVEANIDFFRASIEMQRVIGVFEFLMSQQQKSELRQKILAAIN